MPTSSSFRLVSRRSRGWPRYPALRCWLSLPIARLVAITATALIVTCTTYGSVLQTPGALTVVNESATLFPPDLSVPEPLVQFGGAIAADGDFLAVSGSNSVSSAGNGNVRLYAKTPNGSWVLHTEMASSSDGVPAGSLGQAIGLTGTRLIASITERESTGWQSYVHSFECSSGACVWQQRVGPLKLGLGSARSLAVAGSLMAVRTDTGFDTYELAGGIWSRFAELPGSFDQFTSVSLSAVGSARIVVADPKGTAPGSANPKALVFTRSGNSWILDAELVSPEPGVSTGFGESAAIEGETLVVGAPMSGHAFVFTRAGGSWNLEAQLDAPGAAGAYSFGFQVAIQGGTVFTSGPMVDGGKVFVFEKVSALWVSTAVLTPGVGTHWPGRTLAAGTDWAAAGAPLDSPNGFTTAGSVWVWTRGTDGWEAGHRLMGAPLRAFRYFGSSSAFVSDHLCVAHRNPTMEPGLVAEYSKDGGAWELLQLVLPSDTRLLGGFGAAIEGMPALLVVGGPPISWPESGNPDPPGAVYSFENVNGAWVERQRFEASDPTTDDHFGESLALDGDRLAVGAPIRHHDFVQSAGAVHLLERQGDNWVHRQKIAPPTPTPYGWFGQRVALADDTLVVSAAKDGAGHVTGVLYSYSLQGNDWTLRQTILPPGDCPSPQCSFGQSIALGGGELAVYCRGLTETSGETPDQALIYSRTGQTWSLAQSLRPAGPPDGTSLGGRVLLSGNRLAVSATRSTAAGDGWSSTTNVFTKINGLWVGRYELVSRDGPAAELCNAISLHGTLAAVGCAERHRPPYAKVGAVMIFEGINEAPEGAPDEYLALAGEPFTVPAPGVLGNDVDADGDSLACEIEQTPAHGSLAAKTDGGFTYTPEPRFWGEDFFTYRASDLAAPSQTQRVTLLVRPRSLLRATKTVHGVFATGTVVVYEVALRNDGAATQSDNPGNELVDTLHQGLALDGVTCSTGAVSTSGQTVQWNGALAAGQSASIRIRATILASTPGLEITNQAALRFDADGDGVNEASAVSDDPATPQEQDPTSFRVVTQPIPAISRSGMVLLAGLLALTALAILRRW